MMIRSIFSQYNLLRLVETRRKIVVLHMCRLSSIEIAFNSFATDIFRWKIRLHLFSWIKENKSFALIIIASSFFIIGCNQNSARIIINWSLCKIKTSYTFFSMYEIDFICIQLIVSFSFALFFGSVAKCSCLHVE